MNTKGNILLTGGRAPATLDLARRFRRAGYDVYVAESVKYHICKHSNSVSKCFNVPKPAESKHEYIKALGDIIRSCNIDLLIPTCEEIFYISQELEKLQSLTNVFTDDINKLNSLHNKFEFNQLLANEAICKAETAKITSVDEYRALAEKIAYPHVLKPVYSRFSAKTRVIEHPQNIDIDISPTQPWVIQQFITGKLICTYSICYQGKVLASLCYVNRHSTRENGAGICFETTENEDLSKWIIELVKKMNYTGQIAFDVIQSEDGKLWPIECNPRSTSGIHLFDATDDISSCFVNKSTITTKTHSKRMLSLAMILYFFNNVKSLGKLRDWIKCFAKSKDVVFCWNDPAPFFSQVLAVLNFLKLSWQANISLIEATTHDIEWNGKP